MLERQTFTAARDIEELLPRAEQWRRQNPDAIVDSVDFGVMGGAPFATVWFHRATSPEPTADVSPTLEDYVAGVK